MISIIKKCDFPSLTSSYGKNTTVAYTPGLSCPAKATVLCGESQSTERMSVQEGVLVSALTLTASDLEV